MCFQGRPHISVVRKNGDERGKLDSHEVVLAAVALFGCLNFARNVVSHRPYFK